MKKTRLPFAMLLLALVAVLAACTMVPLDLSNPADVQRLYHSKCARCHALVQPDEVQREDWPDVLDDMGPRANLRPEQRAALEPWLMSENIRLHQEKRARRAESRRGN